MSVITVVPEYTTIEQYIEWNSEERQQAVRVPACRILTACGFVLLFVLVPLAVIETASATSFESSIAYLVVLCAPLIFAPVIAFSNLECCPLNAPHHDRTLSVMLSFDGACYVTVCGVYVCGVGSNCCIASEFGKTNVLRL